MNTLQRIYIYFYLLNISIFNRACPMYLLLVILFDILFKKSWTFVNDCRRQKYRCEFDKSVIKQQTDKS